MVVCDFEGCGKTFSRGDAMRRHYKTAHAHVEALPCTVAGCAATFGLRSSLLRHLRRMHAPEELVEVGEAEPPASPVSFVGGAPDMPDLGDMSGDPPAPPVEPVVDVRRTPPALRRNSDVLRGIAAANGVDPDDGGHSWECEHPTCEFRGVPMSATAYTTHMVMCHVRGYRLLD